MAIALLSFTPGYCPKCGHGLTASFTFPLSRQDFFEGCACTCPECGLHFAYVDAETLRALAAGTGDMGQHIEEGCAE